MTELSRSVSGQGYTASAKNVLAQKEQGTLEGKDVRDLRSAVESDKAKLQRQLRSLEQRREIAESDQGIGKGLKVAAVVMVVAGIVMGLTLSPFAVVLAGVGVPFFLWGVSLVRGGEKTIAEVDSEMSGLQEQIDLIQQALKVLDNVNSSL